MAMAVCLAAVLLVTAPTARAGGPSRVPRFGTGGPAQRTPVLAFLGDSWTAGVGSTDHQGFAPRTAARLRWRSLNFGVGGSGYTAPGAHHSLFGQRVAAVVAAHPDVIVVQGSLNDASSTATAEASAAYRTLKSLYARAGGVPVIVLGASHVPGVPTRTIDRINGSVGAAAARVALPFIDPAALNWTDPRDRGIWFDPLHPNDRGHQLVADHLSPLVRQLLVSWRWQRLAVTAHGAAAALPPGRGTAIR
jgi:lysophospholipase L1-like esterase